MRDIGLGRPRVENSWILAEATGAGLRMSAVTRNAADELLRGIELSIRGAGNTFCAAAAPLFPTAM